MYSDAIYSDVIVNLSLGDRLRVLFGRKLSITVYTKTENLVGKTQGISSVYVDKFFPIRRIMKEAINEKN